MRPSGALHLGHYHGVIKNWLKLQLSDECFFFVADWHALTTHYDDTETSIPDLTLNMVVDWLACGIDPGAVTLFVQSQVPEHAELHLLLSMIAPLGWLERIPSYKDKCAAEEGDERTTYGFLGYPLLQAADVLIYRANKVPVGEDQMAHIEFACEIARRFNYLYGRDKDFAAKAETAIDKLGKKNARLYRKLKKDYQEKGDDEALNVAVAMLDSQTTLLLADRERLLGYLHGSGRAILTEPAGALTEACKVPGLDGRKMSKSYHNTIGLRAENDEINKKIATMQTDPARKRRNDPGTPEKCPVWGLHQLYSGEDTKKWVHEGCRTAGIGCTDCKKPLIDSVCAELQPVRRRALEYAGDLATVKKIVAEGNEAARTVAAETMKEVRRSMGVVYR